MHLSTFSLVARDQVRAEWGVAVASKFLAVGALSAWAEAEVGAVATQAWIRAEHGERGLRLLAEGLSAQEALERMLAEDEGRGQRQVGIVDRDGCSAAHTGSGCLPWAGEILGDGYAAQGNLLAGGETLEAMTARFEALDGAPLSERMVEALAAGQEAGGDRRGQQAAAVRVVGRGGGYGGADIVCDLRVDDHPEPVREIQRLYELHQLYFGATPEQEWLDVGEELAAELRRSLTALGYSSGELATDLDTWAGTENLEERVRGVERIDPVVLAEMRKQLEAADER